MYNLKGKVVFVTGAGGEHGIGRGIALRLAEDGADVVVTDLIEKPYPDADWEGLPALQAEIEALGRRSLALTCDVTDSASVEAADAVLSGAAGSTPVGRLAQTEDLAHAVSFLASDGAAFLTGLSVPVTGGSFMR